VTDISVERREIHVGSTADFEGGRRRMLVVNGREIVVLRHEDRFYAYENVCLHMGGPVAEGVLIPKVEAILGDGGVQLGERFNSDEMHIVCPWHGWEYDLETGEFMGDRRRKLRKFETQQRGDDVYILA
jgi:nitrite reductase (NADH) small subunit